MSKNYYEKKKRLAEYQQLSNEELFIRLLNRYKKRFERDILPEIEKRQSYLSPGEKRRKKHQRAVARLKKNDYQKQDKRDEHKQDQKVS